MYVLSKPAVWIGLLAVFTILLFVSALFIKFKNGWLSWISFLVLEIIGLITVLAFTRNALSEDLKLSDPEAKVIVDITESGVVFERRFISKSTSLLGVELPDKTSEYFQPAKDRILNSCFSKKLFVCKSSSFPGVVLYDAEKNCINELLLKEGLAYVSTPAPNRYITLQKKASETKQGLWSLPVVREQPKYLNTKLLDYSVEWLVIILVLTTSSVIVLCLRKLN